MPKASDNTATVENPGFCPACGYRISGLAHIVSIQLNVSHLACPFFQDSWLPNRALGGIEASPRRAGRDELPRPHLDVNCSHHQAGLPVFLPKRAAQRLIQDILTPQANRSTLATARVSWFSSPLPWPAACGPQQSAVVLCSRLWSEVPLGAIHPACSIRASADTNDPSSTRSTLIRRPADVGRRYQ